MKFILRAGVILAILLMLNVASVSAESFSQRFEKGSSDFGLQAGWGWTFDLPPGPNRSDIGFGFFFPNWQYNLTGIIGDSWYQGAFFYHMEAGGVIADREDKVLFGWSPVMAQYKFLSPKRRWAPNILAGAGFSLTDWDDIAEREIKGDFQFLLHAGAGLEYFKEKGAYSINYRLFHISNSGIKRPNIGLNAHLFTVGMRF